QETTCSRGIGGPSSEMNPNLRPNSFWLKVRTRISQTSICVPTFAQFTTVIVTVPSRTRMALCICCQRVSRRYIAGWRGSSENPAFFSRCTKESNVDPAEVSKKGGILLVNLLQSSRSTFSRGSFLSFFAFKEGMLGTAISVLGG